MEPKSPHTEKMEDRTGGTQIFKEKSGFFHSLSYLSLLRKGMCRHSPSEEKCTGWGAGVENTVFLRTQENPQLTTLSELPAG